MRAERNALRSCERAAEQQVMLVPGIPVRGATIARSSAAKRLRVMCSNAGYLSIRLDDPSFTAPIFASLFADEDGKTFNLIWSRARTSNGH